MPAQPATVLDVGGGAGAYALPLARQGYQVHLVDPVARHVAQAEAAAALQSDAPLAGVRQGDARALADADSSYDVVLLLGPLYHLTDRADRLRALAEARRVLRPGGVLLAAGIGRWASLLDGLRKDWLQDPTYAAIVERGVEQGQHRNPDRVPQWFTTAYFHRPDELAGELVDAGFSAVEVVAVEGPAALLPDLAERLEDPERREALLRSVRVVEAEPELVGATGHLLARGMGPLRSEPA